MGACEKGQNQVTRKCGAGDVLLDSSLIPPSPIMPQAQHPAPVHDARVWTPS